MKKASILFTALIAGTLLLVSWNKASKTNGAVQIRLDFCYVLDGDGLLQGADRNHAVITPSGNTNFACHVSGLDNSTGRAVTFDYSNTGYLCGVDMGIDGVREVTDNWKNVVSASGNVTLQCKTRK